MSSSTLSFGRSRSGLNIPLAVSECGRVGMEPLHEEFVGGAAKDVRLFRDFIIYWRVGDGSSGMCTIEAQLPDESWFPLDQREIVGPASVPVQFTGAFLKLRTSSEAVEHSSFISAY
jgi:hypothetical protein